MKTVTFRIWRGDATGGQLVDYPAENSEGMVVLDVVHQIQAEQANDLACRWNCKAGKCGSCSAEINGMPKLMCMTRLDQIPIDQPVTITPMKAFPSLRDLVTDVSWNFRVKKKIKQFKPRPPDARRGHPALEHLRAHHHGQPPRAPGGGSRRPGVGVTRHPGISDRTRKPGISAKWASGETS